MVLLSLLSAVALAAPREPLIAFSCRYYYPAGDRRLSHYQIYVCDLHGRHRKQLTFGPTDKEYVAWVGKNDLAWVEKLPRKRLAGRSSAANEQSEPPRLLVLYNLKTKRRKVIASGRVGKKDGSTRARPIFEKLTSSKHGEQITDITFIPHGEREAEAKFHLKPAAKEQGESPWLVLHPDRAIKSTEEQVEIDTSAGVGGCKDGASGGLLEEDIDIMGPRVLVSVHRHETVLPAITDGVWPGTDWRTAWCIYGQFSAATYAFETLFKIDWLTGHLKPVLSNLDSIDFEPRSRYWAAVGKTPGSISYGPRKCLADLGGLSVWVSSLYVGDFVTGKRWLINPGVVRTGTAALQSESGPSSPDYKKGLDR